MYSDYDHFKNSPEEPELEGAENTVVRLKNAKLYASYCIMQSYFLRSSTLNKLKLTEELFNIIKDFKYVELCFRIIYKYNMGKLRSYLTEIGVSDFAFDNHLFDHNRMLEDAELSKAIEDTLVRAQQYPDDIIMSISLSMLMMMGGGATQLICNHMKNYYKNKSIKDLRKKVEQEKSEEQYDISKNYVEEWDKSDPQVAEILKKRKLFNDSLAKYRKTVEKSIGISANVKKEEVDDIKQKKKSSKDSKMKKKSTKTSKSSKKGEKPKKVKPEIDRIQILPIGIVKQILGYLDNKTLAKIKNVNKYWEFAVQSLKKDLKTRKSFDKFVAKLEAALDPAILSHSTTVLYNQKSMKEQFEKRLKLEGTISKDLLHSLPPVKDLNKTLKPMFPKQASEYLETYSVPGHNLTTFARSSVDSSQPIAIHQRSNCIRFDNQQVKSVSLPKLPPIGDLFDSTSIVNSYKATESCSQSDVTPEESFCLRPQDSKYSTASSALGVIYSTHGSIEKLVRKVNFRTD